MRAISALLDARACSSIRSDAMLSPFVSRLVLRLLGLALLAWSGLRIYLAILLWQETGRWEEVAHVAALVLGGWGVYDGLTSVALLLAKKWARYLAFVSVALHFALTALLSANVSDPMLKWVMGGCVAIAVLLVVTGNTEPPASASGE